MSTPSTGSPATVTDVEDAIRQSLSKGLGASNMQDFALGLGARVHLGKAGKFNACWSAVRTNAAGKYDFSHSLKVKPVAVTLALIEYPLAAGTVPHVSLAAVRPDQWTETAGRVDILLHVGSLTNAIVWLLVWGP